MWRAVRLRMLVIRLRRRPTWEAQRRADAIEAALLRRMGWTR